MRTYRAFIEMEFEPDENGYLEWEDEYGLTPEEMLEEYDSKPRTEEEMKALFHNELWEYLTSNLDYHSIYVEQV
jgi:transposase